MTALTITDLNTGEVVLQDTFADAFIFEVIAMYTGFEVLPDNTDSNIARLQDDVVSHFFVTFSDTEE